MYMYVFSEGKYWIHLGQKQTILTDAVLENITQNMEENNHIVHYS